MDPSVAAQIAALVVLIILSAFFSSAETAFVSVSQIKMRTLSDDGNKRAKRVIKITEDSSRMLSAILIGNNLVNISASSLATTIALSLFGSKAVSIATGLLTLIVLIFGEISPKTVATTYANKIALAYSGVIWVLMNVLRPVIFIINKMAKGFLCIFGLNPDKKNTQITEDELRTIVDVSHEEGVLESDEHEMINNVFDFGDSTARDVMIPRVDMVSVSIGSTYQEIIRVFREFMFTRLPVYEGSVDNVIGIINVKDLLLYDNPDTFSVRKILRKPYFTFEYKKISELMDELKKTSNNCAIIVDEYGSTVGMITLEDLLEEIVGEIRDEYDEDEEDDVVKLGDNEYMIAGSVHIDDLNDIIEFPKDAENDNHYDSIGGFIIDCIDKLPQKGDEVVLDGLRLVVEECDKNRITKVHAYVIPKDEEKEASE